MLTLPTVKKFRKRTRIQNLLAQLNVANQLIGVLARTARVNHKGLIELRENYLEASEDLRAVNGYVWNGEKPAPEMILDIAERVEKIFIEAGLNPSVFQHTEKPTQQGVNPNSNEQKNGAPTSFKV